MDETFIQYVWQYQQFDHRNLRTIDGRAIAIVVPGIQNLDAGPDFTGVRLRIDGLIWSGNVELHVKSPDWYQHKHHLDAAYNNVILHVVWQTKGRPAVREDGTEIPTLELQHLVPENLLLKYNRLIAGDRGILCSAQLPGVERIHIFNMLDRALAGRLERKSMDVRAELDRTGHDWEETTYRILARNFGFKKNAEPMAHLAGKVPLRIIKKCGDRPEMIEALLFGSAGLLDGRAADDYQHYLEGEYLFLKKKYKLQDPGLRRETWKFSRLRPPNFPTVRLAQFAQLLSKVPNLFSGLVREENLREFLKEFRIRQSPYWTGHFDFGKEAKKAMPGLGVASLENIVINTFAPVLTAYGKARDDQKYVNRALEYLQLIKPEKNRIIKKWETSGLMPASAFDSQAMLELYNEFCLNKRCAACTIGSALIGKSRKA